jgi:hypothetical protein
MFLLYSAFERGRAFIDIVVLSLNIGRTRERARFIAMCEKTHAFRCGMNRSQESTFFLFRTS